MPFLVPAIPILALFAYSLTSFVIGVSLEFHCWPKLGVSDSAFAGAWPVALVLGPAPYHLCGGKQDLLTM